MVAAARAEDELACVRSEPSWGEEYLDEHTMERNQS